MFWLFLDLLKSQTTEEEFKEILIDADNDIKFNRVLFKKKTGLTEYIKICSICTIVNLRSPEGENDNTIEIMNKILAEIYKSDGSKEDENSLKKIIKTEYQNVKNKEGNLCKAY